MTFVHGVFTPDAEVGHAPPGPHHDPHPGPEPHPGRWHPDRHPGPDRRPVAPVRVLPPPAVRILPAPPPVVVIPALPAPRRRGLFGGLLGGPLPFWLLPPDPLILALEAAFASEQHRR